MKKSNPLFITAREIQEATEWTQAGMAAKMKTPDFPKPHSGKFRLRADMIRYFEDWPKVAEKLAEKTPPPIMNEVLSMRAVEKMVGWSSPTIKKRIALGEFPKPRIGKKFLKEDIEFYLQSNQEC